jgi:hypothetical protein
MHEETRRFDIELFADVFANLDQIAPAFAAGTGLRFVPVLDARQFRRQRVAPWALVRAG